MNFGINRQIFGAIPRSHQKFDLSKPKIHDAQLSNFTLFPFLINS